TAGIAVARVGAFSMPKYTMPIDNVVPTYRSSKRIPMTADYDVIVVGAGNAALCAALAARERCEKVLVLERANEDEAGGNSRFTAGLFRIVYNGVDDLRQLIPDPTEQEVATTDFGDRKSVV